MAVSGGSMESSMGEPKPLWQRKSLHIDRLSKGLCIAENFGETETSFPGTPKIFRSNINHVILYRCG